MILRDRRGYGIFGFFILFIFLVIMWALFLGKALSAAGEQAVANGVTGFDAFLWSNLNLWFFLVLIVVAVVYIRIGGSQ